MELTVKKENVAKLKSGEIIHAIKKSSTFKPGDLIHFATRDKKYKQVMIAECTSTQEITITLKRPDGRPVYGVFAGRGLNSYEVEVLAHNEGYENAAALFKELTGESTGFTGIIIHWTDLRY